jgi:hypothetical protein
MYLSFKTIAGCITAWMFFNIGYYSWRRYIYSTGEGIKSTGPIVQWVDENNPKISGLTRRRVASKSRETNNAINLSILGIVVIVLFISTNAITTTATMITATYQSIIDTIKVAYDNFRRKY